MKGTDEQCPNSAEAFVVPASTSAPRFFLWGILILASVPLFGLVVRFPQVAYLDRSILDALITIRTPALTQVMLVVTNVLALVMAVSWTIVSGGAIRVFSDSWREGLITPVAMVHSPAITALIKEFIESARPAFPECLVVEGPCSSPSGHADAVAAVCAVGVLLMFHHPTNRIPSDEDGSLLRLPTRVIKGFVVAGTITLIVLIALTRSYLGAHWFSDVVADALVGTASSFIVAELLLGST